MHDPHLGPTRRERIESLDESEEVFRKRQEREAALREHREKLENEWKERAEEDEWWEERGQGSLEDFLPEEFDEIVPPEIQRHLREAQKEALLAFRGLLDYWIRRSGGAPRRRRRWETIEPT